MASDALGLLSGCSTLSNGVRIPRLAVGTFRVTGETAENVVRWALDIGYRHIDTASVYKNESEIGRAIRDSGVDRGSVFITSKLSPYEHGYDNALAACQASLDRLGTSYLDLYLIHWPGKARKPPDWPEHAAVRMDTWRALEKLYAEGKCRAIGVSNYTVRHLQHMLPLCATRPMVNQVELHPLLSQSDLRAFCKEEGIQVAAYSPFGCGEILTTQKVLELAGAAGCRPGQLLLQWNLQQGCLVIPKTSSKERLEENAKALDVRLSADCVAALDRMNEDHHFCWNAEKVS